MSNVQQTAITAALTAIVSAFLGYLAAQHYIETAAVNELAAAIVVLLVAGYGAWANERKTKEREVVALNAGIEKSNQEPTYTPPVPPASAPAVIAAYAPAVPEVKPSA
jgi:hypothetical protein